MFKFNFLIEMIEMNYLINFYLFIELNLIWSFF